jgi:hypothetical protein
MSTILPTVASLILAQAIGFVWYHPSLGSGSRWMAAMKQSNPDFVPPPDPKIYAASAGTWLVSALLYSHLISTMFGGSQAAWMDLCGLSLVLGGAPTCTALCTAFVLAFAQHRPGRPSINPGRRSPSSTRDALRHSKESFSIKVHLCFS